MSKKIILLGAGDFVYKVLMQLAAQDIDCAAVSSTAQAGKKLPGGSSFAQALAEKQISCTLTENPAELAGSFASDTLFISYGAPWIIGKKTLHETFHNNVVNIHGTRLPKERGGTLFSWQILTGQHTGMCLAHRMTPQIDQGEVLAYEEFIYPAACRKPADYLRVYEEKNLAFLASFIQKYQGSLPEGKAQPEYLSSYWPRLLAGVHGWINWSWNATELERHICAFDDPYAGARCRWNGQEVILKDVWAQATDGYTHPFQQGLVYRSNGQWLSVAVNGGELLVCSITDTEGNSLLDAIKPGDRLYTTAADLEQALRKVVKTKDGLSAQPLNTQP